MRRPPRRNCPILGCPHAMRSGWLLCHVHWARVPDALRAELEAAWKASIGLDGTEAGAAARRNHLDLVRRAIAAVEGQE